ncbi:hypothetical protein HOY80DRAFT_883347, partial [Tuber brumale]
PDINDSVPMSTDNVVSPTVPSTARLSLSISPLKSPHPPSKTDTHPSIRSTLSLAVNHYIITPSFVCILALLIYIPTSPNLFSFHN